MITKNHKRFLLPRFDTFGDIVLLQGFIAHMQYNVPDATISLLVREGYDQLAALFPSNIYWLTTDLHPYIECVDADQENLSILLDMLDKENFDCLLTTTYNRTWLDDLIAAKLTGAQRIAIGDCCSRKLWADDLHVRLGLSINNLYECFVPVIEASPEIEKYQILAETILQSSESLPVPRLTVPFSAQEGIQDVLEALYLSPGAYYACVVTCTASLPYKSWHSERFVAIMVWLKKIYSLNPLIMGHESERDRIQVVADMARVKGVKPTIWFGKTGELVFLAGLLQQARFYIGNDTGPMHIAAALAVPTVAIFGGGHWPRFLPVGERAIGIAAELPCFGCNWGDCIFGDAPCVKLVTVDDVENAIEVILSNKPISSNYIPASSDEKTRFKHLYDICLESKANELKRLETKYTELDGKLTQFHTSLSWRLTKPLRWLGDKIRGL